MNTYRIKTYSLPHPPKIFEAQARSAAEAIERHTQHTGRTHTSHNMRLASWIGLSPDPAMSALDNEHRQNPTGTQGAWAWRIA